MVSAVMAGWVASGVRTISDALAKIPRRSSPLAATGLLDMGSLQKGEDNLAGTRRPTVVVVSPKRAESIGVTTGTQVRVSNANGSITLPVLVEDIHDDAVWVPRNSFGSQTLISLDAVHGDVVTVVKA